MKLKILISLTVASVIGLSLTGCMADKALLGINIKKTKKINSDLTKSIKLADKKSIPDYMSELSTIDMNVILIYTITGEKKAYRYPEYNYAKDGYTLTNRANFYCDYAHSKYQKIYRYNFKYNSDSEAFYVKIINQSYCPICFSSGTIRPLKGVDREKLCRFDTPTGQKTIKQIKEIRNKITDELYRNLVDFAKFKQNIKDTRMIYRSYFYYKSLNGMEDNKKLEMTRQYIQTTEEEEYKKAIQEERAREIRVKRFLKSYRQKNNLSSSSSNIQIKCLNNNESMSISNMQQKRAMAKGIGSGIALGYSKNNGMEKLSNQDIYNICISELNMKSLDCFRYKEALKSCRFNLRRLSLPK